MLKIQTFTKPYIGYLLNNQMQYLICSDNHFLAFDFSQVFLLGATISTSYGQIPLTTTPLEAMNYPVGESDRIMTSEFES